MNFKGGGGIQCCTSLLVALRSHSDKASTSVGMRHPVTIMADVAMQLTRCSRMLLPRVEVRPSRADYCTTRLIFGQW